MICDVSRRMAIHKREAKRSSILPHYSYFDGGENENLSDSEADTASMGQRMEQTVLIVLSFSCRKAESTENDRPFSVNAEQSTVYESDSSSGQPTQKRRANHEKARERDIRANHRIATDDSK